MPRPDIAVYSSDNQLVLVVEVKRKLGASLDWVMELRQQLLIYSAIPKSRYFLLALSDYFYLWKDGAQDAAPDYQVDAKEALAAYLKPASLSLEKISSNGLEFLVSAWLRDLIYIDEKERNNPALQWLFESGLYDAIKDGKVLLEAAA